MSHQLFGIQSLFVVFTANNITEWLKSLTTNDTTLWLANQHRDHSIQYTFLQALLTKFYHFETLKMTSERNVSYSITTNFPSEDSTQPDDQISSRLRYVSSGFTPFQLYYSPFLHMVLTYFFHLLMNQRFQATTHLTVTLIQ